MDEHTEVLRAELTRRLALISGEMLDTRKKLTEVSDLVKGATCPFARQSGEARAIMNLAVRDERGRIAKLLQERKWTLEQIGELFSVSTTAARVMLIQHERRLRGQSTPLPGSVLTPGEARGVEVYSAGFSVRALNRLDFLGITHLVELAVLDEGTLLRTKNVGRKTLKEFKEVLAAHGLRLGMRPSEVKK